MRNVIQDILGNISLFSAAWIIGRRLPRRKLFWLRTALCFAVFCVLRQIYFNGIVPHLDQTYKILWNTCRFAGHDHLVRDALL